MFMSEEAMADKIRKQKEWNEKNAKRQPANFIQGLTEDKIKEQLHLLEFGDYKRGFSHDRKFLQLNRLQRLTYLVLASHMLLETGQHVNIFGCAGTGKSEALMCLYNDFKELISISAPTGVIANK